MAANYNVFGSRKDVLCFDAFIYLNFTTIGR